MSNLELLPFHNWLVDLRRELHQIPELGYKEGKTQAKICRVLDELGVPYKKGVGKTGVVARVKSENAGPMVAFRADMDALPLEESNDISYKSLHPGLMHACGHDGHAMKPLTSMKPLQVCLLVQQATKDKNAQPARA